MSDQKPCGCSSANGKILRNPAICQKHPDCPNAPKPAEPVKCKKAPHIGTGYLHDADDDRPYDVDGVLYCGRCHRYGCSGFDDMVKPAEPDHQRMAELAARVLREERPDYTKPSEPKGSEPPMTPAEARECLDRFNSSHWGKPDRARYSIPARQSDDDIRMARFIDHAEALAAKLKERDEEITQLLEACGDMELKRAIRARRKEAKR